MMLDRDCYDRNPENSSLARKKLPSQNFIFFTLNVSGVFWSSCGQQKNILNMMGGSRLASAQTNFESK